MKIPFHSLVLTENIDLFPDYEILSLNQVAYDLVGERIISEPITIEEIKHRLKLKLSLGERVIIDVRDIPYSTIREFTKIAENQFATIAEHDGQPCSLDLVNLKNQWKGVTVIADIHGEQKHLTEAVNWAASRSHFVVYLGDVLDYGSGSLQAVETVYKMVMNGDATMVIGNHERKILRWLMQKEDKNIKVKLSEGNKVTTKALMKLDDKAKNRWVARFRALLNRATYFAELDHYVFAHAAIHPSFWGDRQDKMIENFAMFGETKSHGSNFSKTYSWIDSIPSDRHVIVGHDKRSALPMTLTGLQGGKVTFLDTGCGKGGHLTSADLRFNGNGILQLESFHRY